MKSERRINPRIPFRTHTVINSNFAEPMDGGTIDVSRGGALLDSPAHLGVGHDITLNFETGYQPLKGVRARIKRSHPVFWNRRHLVAVEFTEPMDDLVQMAEVQSGSGS